VSASVGWNHVLAANPRWEDTRTALCRVLRRL
jgi:hypothetical protein